MDESWVSFKGEAIGIGGGEAIGIGGRVCQVCSSEEKVNQQSDWLKNEVSDKSQYEW